MLRGLLNKHWFIKRFMPVYIAGLIVAGFGFTAHASAATISQIVSDTQTNESPAQGEKIGTNISGVPQSITIKWSHSLGGSVGLELKLLECPSSSYNTFTTECRFINSGPEGHGALALQTGASATDVTFDLSTTPPFNPSKFYAFNVVNSTDADDTLGATCITGECARHSNSYGTSNDVVGFGCTNSNEFGEGPGICGSVKNISS